MSLKDQIQSIRTQLQKELNPKTPSFSEFGNVEFSIPEIPRAVEKKGNDWVSHGEDNLYPYKISDLKYGSPIHNAIVSTAADMISGDGFLINGAKTLEESVAYYNALPQEVKTEYDFFIENPNNDKTLEEITNELAFDLKEQGACCYEVIYNSDFTKTVTRKYVDVRDIRPGKMEDGKIKDYWYCRDWKDYKKSGYKPTKIVAFNKDDKENLNQLVYIKRGKSEYFGEPDYVGALTWIQTDFQMGIFHLSNIENGMNPSMRLRFYKLPRTEEDKQTILDEVRRQFVGPKRTGKHMVFFSEGKELAPDIDPVQTSNLDKQLLLLAELCDKKILTGHKLTSPLLAGISVSGQLGGNTEIEKAFKIYDKTRIEPFRKLIYTSYQKQLDFNNVPVKIRINPFNPFI